MAFQALIPYALAAYGGYKGYQASKDAGGSGLQRLLAGATGAFLGYQGGQMFPGVKASIGTPGGFVPITQQPVIQNITSNIPFLNTGAAQSNIYSGADQLKMLRQSSNAALGDTGLATETLGQIANAGGPRGTPAQQNFLQKLFTRQRMNKAGDMFLGELEVSPGKAATGVAALAYLSGAFKNQPQDVFTPTYNLAVADLQKQRGGFKYIDPVTGDEKTFDQIYIPEADAKNRGDFQMGPYAIERNRLKEGGLAEVRKFNQGGINYLPSKRTHDENDANNYERALGYVEDGSGTGDKDEDTMLAQLADGEFVTRADGVLGAGIIAGGNPNSMKDMREKGAQYFYEQQRRYKRVFDLLQGSKNAEAKAN
jgi:hypothetical protein